MVLGDFAENYQFVVQDEIQSFHWNKTQATLHPTVIYYKLNVELKNESIWHQSAVFIAAIKLNSFVHSILG